VVQGDTIAHHHSTTIYKLPHLDFHHRSAAQTTHWQPLSWLIAPLHSNNPSALLREACLLRQITGKLPSWHDGSLTSFVLVSLRWKRRERRKKTTALTFGLAKIISALSAWQNFSAAFKKAMRVRSNFLSLSSAGLKALDFKHPTMKPFKINRLVENCF